MRSEPIAVAPPPAEQEQILPPRLAHGIELIGEFEGSGFKEPPHLVLSEAATNRAASLLTWLHAPYVQVPMLLTIAAFDIWLFAVHGVAGGLRSALYSPALLLGVLLSVVVATAFHELGHASACRYGGARPGVLGAGVYLVWPAFYCDVTDA